MASPGAPSGDVGALGNISTGGDSADRAPQSEEAAAVLGPGAQAVSIVRPGFAKKLATVQLGPQRIGVDQRRCTRLDEAAGSSSWCLIRTAAAAAAIASTTRRDARDPRRHRRMSMRGVIGGTS